MSLLPFLVAAPTARAQTPELLPGIDVSHWQGTIDWTQVAASGVRFAIAKATDGRDGVDEMYATNKAGAQAAGIAFTAYHFARPDATTGDAIAEADHFVDTARLVPGNLIPALDLEQTGGLTHSQVTQWVLTWLGRVTQRLGVRPMVYTSPNGWENRTGDTTAVVEAGYTVLWVAHWNVDSPRVPAGDWGGNGWTFWQHTSDGTVPGIVGRVDLDWFRGTSLGPVTIPSPDVAPPVATVVLPTGLTDPITVSFSEAVRHVTDGNVVMWTPDGGAFVGLDLVCRSLTTVVDCFDGGVRSVRARPAAPLLAGEDYTVSVNPATVVPAIEDLAGNMAATVELSFAAATEVDDGSRALGYAWRTAANRRAYGGSYAVERHAGAMASFAFAGRSVTWYTAQGPALGKVAVLVDGRRLGSFDQYAAHLAFGVGRTFRGLTRGWHTITIRVLGTRSPDATDAQVVVDAFGVRGDIVRTPKLAQTWGTVDAPRASGGTVAAADLARASVTFAFRGTSVVWYTVRGPRQGRAAMYVDGALVQTIDNYATEPAYDVAQSVTGLADGPHTLRIVVLGTSRPAADGTLIAVDRFVVA